MHYVKGNILDADYGIICHQVNCQLVMGSGLAKQLKEKWPIVHTEYVRVMSAAKPEDRLGKCQLVEIVPGYLFVANLFGQYNYGHSNQRYTDYNALAMSIKSLKDWIKNYCPPNFPVYFPKNIGCGLGGGNWNVVEGIIRDIIPDAVIVRFEEKK